MASTAEEVGEEHRSAEAEEEDRSGAEVEQSQKVAEVEGYQQNRSSGRAGRDLEVGQLEPRAHRSQERRKHPVQPDRSHSCRNHILHRPGLLELQKPRAPQLGHRHNHRCSDRMIGHHRRLPPKEEGHQRYRHHRGHYAARVQHYQLGRAPKASEGARHQQQGRRRRCRTR